MQFECMVGDERQKRNSGAVKLLKMHGSINWSYCNSCQDFQEFDLLKMKKFYEEDTISYPVVGICKKCQGLRRPLLVPPLSFKFLQFPPLVQVWNSARRSIEDAEYLVIVGYSFSEADTYLTKIISRSMGRSPNQKMIVVDTNPKLVNTLRERFDAHIENFDKKRILKVCESCENMLPKVLNSMIGEGDAEKEETSTQSKKTSPKKKSRTKSNKS